MRKLRVAVVGCGSAGPAAAILLRRHGHEVELFERAPVCLPVGAGFLLQPSGMTVLKELGIHEQVAARGSRIDRLHAIERGGRLLMDLRYADVDRSLFGLGLHRPVLLEALLGVMAEAGVVMHWDWEVADLLRENKRSTLVSTRGERSGPYDLLVIADGARSVLRQKAGFHGVNHSYPWGAHWFIGTNPGVFPQNELYQIVDGTRKLLGFMPTGKGMEESGPPLTSLFWSVKLSGDASIRARPLDDWKRGILTLHPAAEPFFDQIGDWSQVLTARYGDVRMHHWHGEGVVILGDAAHAMSPQLGQGVNLALADAACLARCVERLDLEDALPRYTKMRRLALGYYQLSTRSLTPLFQSDLEWLEPYRSLFFRVSQRIGPARRMMTRTMAGQVGNLDERWIDR